MQSTVKDNDLKSLKRSISAFRSSFKLEHQEIKSQKILTALLLQLGIKYLDLVNPTFSWHHSTNSKKVLELFELVQSKAPQIVNESIEKPDKVLVESIEKHFASLDPNVLSLTTKNISTIGDIYQMWQRTERIDALNKIQKADKNIQEKDLISFTQIYTPDWIVEFLLDKTLVDKIKNSNQSLEQIKNLTVLDPACGSGHFLAKAIDKLLTTYRQFGLSDNQAMEHILTKQLFGLDVDRYALFVVSLIICLLCLKLDTKQVISLDNLGYLDLNDTESMGSLYRDFSYNNILDKTYDVVVTNPPYIGRKLMDRGLKANLKKDYPDSYSDLSSAFVNRCLEFLTSTGSFGVITQASILTLPTYRKLRKFATNNYDIDLVVDLGPGTFPTQQGEKINSSLIVFSNPGKSSKNAFIPFIDLKKTSNKRDELGAAIEKLNGNNHAESALDKIFYVSRDSIANIYNYTFNYQIPQFLTKRIKELDTLNDISAVKQGLATTDNKTFVRHIWQIDPVELNKKWYHYAKGAGSNKWFSPVIHVVDWQNNGENIKRSVMEKYPYLNGKANWVVKNEDYYFKSGLSFSFVSTNGLAVRTLPKNCIFDVGASSIFPNREDQYFLLGYLNSGIVNAFISSINPTVNFQVGDLKRIPVVSFSNHQKEKLGELAQYCHQKAKQFYELTNPTASYIDIKYNNLSQSSFANWFEQMAKQTSAENNQWQLVYASTVEAIKSEIKELESQIDSIVFEQFTKELNWNKQEEAMANVWIENNKPISNYNIPEKIQTLFSWMILTDSLIQAQNTSSQMREYLNIHHQASRNSDYAAFIRRSFRRTPPSDLLLEDNSLKL